MKKFKLTREDKKNIVKVIFVVLKFLAWVLIIIPLWVIYIGSFIVPYGILIWAVLWFIFNIMKLVQKVLLGNYVKGNTITYGGRGKGKGMIFQEVMNSEDTAMCNIPYGDHVKVVKPVDYYNAISPNTALKFLKGDVVIVEKKEGYEGVPYYLDDGALFFPNYNDQAIKMLYPSITLQIPAIRHLFGVYNPIQAQGIERLYKPLRELQDDGYIKALKTIGKSWLWRRLPIVRKYFVVKWRYYEQFDAAIKGLLPWSRMGITNEMAKRIYMTTASALKEQFTATNGIIHQSSVWIKRKTVKYDTRYYHLVFFGISIKDWLKEKEDERIEVLRARIILEDEQKNAMMKLAKENIEKELKKPLN